MTLNCPFVQDKQCNFECCMAWECGNRVSESWCGLVVYPEQGFHCARCGGVACHDCSVDNPRGGYCRLIPTVEKSLTGGG